MNEMSLTRRSILKRGVALAGASALPRLGFGTGAARQVRFGVITDVHHGLGSRTEERLEEFLSAASRRDLDFVIQLGDFHHPVPEAAGFLKLWGGYRGQRYGVLGNHDMDLGSKSQQVENWRIPGRFYSFDSEFLHFVVLDANFMKLDNKLAPYEKGNWYRSGITASWIDPEQIEWLKADLKESKKPTVIFVHQPLDDIWEGGSVPNRAEVRKVLEESGKVVAVLQGHDHQDASETRNGIFYWRVNSSSYAWVGEKYGRMAPYDRSLFAFVEIGAGKVEGRRSKVEPELGDVVTGDLGRLYLKGEGRRGIFEGDSPFTRGVPNPDRFAASITSVDLMLI